MKSALDVHSNPASDASNAVFTIQGASSTSLTSAPNPSVSGQSVALTATVTPSAATGTVEFFDGVTSLGTSPVSSGTAVLNTSSLAVGAHTNLTAVYSGDALYSGSTSAAHSHTVNQASTTSLPRALSTGPFTGQAAIFQPSLCTGVGSVQDPRSKRAT